MVIDSSSIYEDGLLETFRQGPSDENVCFYLDTLKSKLILPKNYAYLRVNDTKNVTIMKEKVQISRMASTGGFGFVSGEVY